MRASDKILLLVLGAVGARVRRSFFWDDESGRSLPVRRRRGQFT
jgi:hypothetical protein